MDRQVVVLDVIFFGVLETHNLVFIVSIFKLVHLQFYLLKVLFVVVWDMWLNYGVMFSIRWGVQCLVFSWFVIHQKLLLASCLGLENYHTTYYLFFTDGIWFFFQFSNWPYTKTWVHWLALEHRYMHFCKLLVLKLEVL